MSKSFIRTLKKALKEENLKNDPSQKYKAIFESRRSKWKKKESIKSIVGIVANAGQYYLVGGRGHADDVLLVIKTSMKVNVSINKAIEIVSSDKPKREKKRFIEHMDRIFNGFKKLRWVDGNWHRVN